MANPHPITAQSSAPPNSSNLPNADSTTHTSLSPNANSDSPKVIDSNSKAYRKDQMRYRSLTGLLGSLSISTSTDSELESTIFRRRSGAVPYTYTETNVPRKIAFLLNQHCEDIAVMPVRLGGSGNLYSLVVTSSARDREYQRKYPHLVLYEEEDDEGIGYTIKKAEVPEDAKDNLDQYLVDNWQQIPWHHHIGIFELLLKNALKIKPSESTIISKTHRVSMFQSYCFLTSYRKNQARLSRYPAGNAPKFIDLMKTFVSKELLNTRGARLPQSKVYPTKMLDQTLACYFSSEDMKAIHALSEHAFTPQERADHGFSQKRIFATTTCLDPTSTSVPIPNEVDIWVLLVEFVKVLVAALEQARYTYASLPETSPTHEDIQHFRKVIKAVSRFFNYLLYSSPLLKWIIEQWLCATLTNRYSKMVYASQSRRDLRKASEQLELTPGDENADEVSSPQTISGKIIKWLKLSFATYRYAAELGSITKYQLADFYAIGVTSSKGKELPLEPWKDTVREVYRICEGGKNWEKNATACISEVERRASTRFLEDRKWVAFTTINRNSDNRSPHCFTSIASLHLLSKVGHLPDPILKHSLPFIGASVPCCPLCAVIIESINEDLKQLKQPIIPLNKHPIPCGAALPTGLPKSIRNRILKKLSEMLYAAVPSGEWVRQAARERRGGR
ncbi:hypothetical protein BJ508DRAFT_339163 [Ascobolus immersus RN42]|uniref:Uncharacterized protein n=1 Tax=Ascobolus immersus RN42 TaxID=1160509 RepID=A0A3N4HTN6_ASCIM|nr:hypothetical protein BJ508DRAFT_339163 [Ascobolus immersus RN42]